jgi:hypothetical protein
LIERRYKMTNNQYDLDMEAYHEEMFERRANGMGTMTFAEWKSRREAIRAYFASFERGTVE